MPLCAALVSLRALHPALSAAGGGNGSNAGGGDGSNAGGGNGVRKPIDTLSGWYELSPPGSGILLRPMQDFDDRPAVCLEVSFRR
ncbi:hypothetical protein T484DRAFT_3354544 [Baffinella frigidus]|nr:hypothetical protein T484DRAFT_3354544 [Cryptophyta sp. CCMP2293]